MKTFQIVSRWDLTKVLYSTEVEDNDPNPIKTTVRDANLSRADLSRANLSDATLPDGRIWSDYVADPLSGVCSDADVRAKAIAAWGKHTWLDCPMHAAYGWGAISDAPQDKRIAVAAFIAFFDAKLLPTPQ